MGAGGRKRKILIIDDETDILQLVQDAFKLYGFETEGYSNPYLALKAFEDASHVYDLVLLDLKLGDVHGETVYNKIKESDPDAKVCVFTAMETTEFKNNCPSFDDSYIIKKPVRISSMVDKINSILQ
jgi:DNA-binding NtrC family response regulator